MTVLEVVLTPFQDEHSVDPHHHHPEDTADASVVATDPNHTDAAEGGVDQGPCPGVDGVWEVGDHWDQDGGQDSNHNGGGSQNEAAASQGPVNWATHTHYRWYPGLFLISLAKPVSMQVLEENIKVILISVITNILA